MASVRRIPVVRHGGDVYAADETKVHTFSRQAIAAMLEVAEGGEAPVSSAPPPAAPPSGVRLKDGSPVRTSARMSTVPPPPALPAVWAEDDDDDEDGIAPTTLHERAEAISDSDLVTEDVAEPPPSSAPSSSPALASLTPPSANVRITIAPITASVPPLVLAPPVVAPAPQRDRGGIDFVTVAIFVVTFAGTILAAWRWLI